VLAKILTLTQERQTQMEATFTTTRERVLLVLLLYRIVITKMELLEVLGLVVEILVLMLQTMLVTTLTRFPLAVKMLTLQESVSQWLVP
jgi:hypothetical protein